MPGDSRSRDFNIEQPADRRRIDGVGPRYVDQCFAIGEPLQRFLTLVRIQLSRSAFRS
jgi:hypothetical protein